MVLDPVLRVTDFFLPNAAEAHALTGHPGAEPMPPASWPGAGRWWW